MFFGWLKNRRRRRLLGEPFPVAWNHFLVAIPHVQLLPAEDQTRIRDVLRVLRVEKEWEGCRGLELTEEITVTIAALASILILHMEGYYFDNVQTILIYPQEFTAPAKQFLGGEAVLESESDNLGEAHYRGPVILCWQEIREDLRAPGYGRNLIFHEFAHQLDMLNGAADGVPLLRERSLVKRWPRVMANEYRRLDRSTQRGRQTLLDPYGAYDPAEFFAVVTESFFDHPGELKANHPELYQLFADYYRQDPASWPG